MLRTGSEVGAMSLIPKINQECIQECCNPLRIILIVIHLGQQVPLQFDVTICKSLHLVMLLVIYLNSVGAILFEFVAPPLDKNFTTSGHLGKVSRGTY